MWLGDCGKAVLLRHRNGLETLYDPIAQRRALRDAVPVAMR